MPLEKKGVIILVIGAVVGGFIAGYLGSRLPEIIQGKPVPKTAAAVTAEPRYVKLEKLESTVEEQVAMQFKPYRQKLESWDSEKEGINTKLGRQNEKLEVLEQADDYFYGIVEEGSKRIMSVESNLQKNQEEIQAVKEELGPGDKYDIQMVYANSQFRVKFNTSAYNNKFYLDELLSVVEEWQKSDVNRVAIIERPYGKGKAVFFAGLDNRFNIEIVQTSNGIDKLLVLSDIDSIPDLYTISSIEAAPRLKQLFEEYGSASLLPFKVAFKKPSATLLFGEEPEHGKYQGKYYVR